MTMRIQVANAPCSWGVLEFSELSESRGAACQRVLTEIAEAGYAGTELGDWGFMPTDPAALRELLELHELELVGAFVPVALSRRSAHEDGVEAALRTARLVVAVAPQAFIVLADDNGTVPDRVQLAGRVSLEQGLTDARWEIFAAGADRVARAVREETGLRTVFHHHCAGYVETPTEVAALMERTDPDLLGLCLDTGHYAFGGGDPLEGLGRYGGRVWHVHLKDFDPRVAARGHDAGWDYFRAVEQGVFCEIGRGQVDFAALLSQLTEQGYRGWAVVEQDVLPGMGSPLESAKQSRAYLARLGL
jgi:inosose dehydratase